MIGDIGIRGPPDLRWIRPLSDYFDLNKEDISARQYTYAEISGHYIFKLHNDKGHKVY